MPAKKSAKTTKTRAKKAAATEVVESEVTPSQTTSSPRARKKLFFILLVVGIILLLYYKKSWFIAATVNGQVISNLEVISRMNSLYREKTITQMTNEKILEQEATKKGAKITPAEINSKMAETEKQYGGTDSFNSLLTQQGLTRADFESQTRVQLIVEKLYGQEASPSAADVEKFMADNKDAPEATDAGKFRALAEEQIKQQNLSKIFSEKFQSLKTAAKIQIF